MSFTISRRVETERKQRSRADHNDADVVHNDRRTDGGGNYKHDKHKTLHDTL
jgi:hypothetical protein